MPYTKVTTVQYALINKGRILWGKGKNTFNTIPAVEAFLDNNPQISDNPTRFAKIDVVKFTKDEP